MGCTLLNPSYELPDIAGFGVQRCDLYFAYGGIVRNGKEDRRDQLLEYPPQAAGSGLVFGSDIRNLLEHRLLDAQLDALILENLHELAVNAVPGLDQYPHQHFAGQVAKTGDEGQPAGEFRNQAELKQIRRLDPAVEPIQDALIVPL